MKIDRNIGKADKPSSGGPITGKNYIERAVAYMRSSGRANGDHPVIRSEAGSRGSGATGELATPDKWRAWMVYFSAIGYPTAAARQLGVMTVPTDYPWLFDAAAPTEIPPEPLAQPARAVHPLTDYERDLMIRRAAKGMGDGAAKLRDEGLRSGSASKSPTAAPIDHSKPVRLSSEALARFGIQDREERE